MHQDGDAEAGVFDRPMLGGVGVVRGLPRVPAVRPGSRTGGAAGLDHAAPVRRSGDLANAIREIACRILRREAAVVRLDLVLMLPDGFKLRDLLFERHAAQQILNARVHGLARVLVQRDRSGQRLGRKRWSSDSDQCSRADCERARIQLHLTPHEL